MIDSYIAVIDSGIGGISVLKELVKNFPTERFLYFGDNFNAPYGNKGRKELLSLTLSNLNIILRYNVKAIVLACNTLSVNVLGELMNFSPVQVFGTFPPVENFLIKGKRGLLLATERTAEKYRGIRNLHSVGLKKLVIDIEKNAFNLTDLNFEKHLFDSVGDFVDKKGFYDVVILGCTHYVFIKNKIFKWERFCYKKSWKFFIG